MAARSTSSLVFSLATVLCLLLVLTLLQAQPSSAVRHRLFRPRFSVSGQQHPVFLEQRDDPSHPSSDQNQQSDETEVTKDEDEHEKTESKPRLVQPRILPGVVAPPVPTSDTAQAQQQEDPDNFFAPRLYRFPTRNSMQLDEAHLDADVAEAAEEEAEDDQEEAEEFRHPRFYRFPNPEDLPEEQEQDAEDLQEPEEQEPGINPSFYRYSRGPAPQVSEEEQFLDPEFYPPVVEQE